MYYWVFRSQKLTCSLYVLTTYPGTRRNLALDNVLSPFGTCNMSHAKCQSHILWWQLDNDRTQNMPGFTILQLI